ncbi:MULTISPECIES: hypothetical protein [unclassified Vibrio]|uniref:hypothetical protein n=1 Tax=unclassified Vibrio TaxID=2614977 RepID=UPI0027C08CB7|nr:MULTISPECIES: hypothetical protein [unclassified Vibrio]MDQ2107596.1 hypothetical protein [Vibrio sp. 2017_1457_15]MDQ2160408.1 hypothetical protein [Vibrio sp. 2017_1457_13]
MWTRAKIKLEKDNRVAIIISGSTSKIKPFDALLLRANQLIEIAEVHAQEIVLREPWPSPSETLDAKVIPTSGDFNQAVREIRLLRENTANNISALEAWGTQTGTVTFKGEDGEEHTARTLQQMDADASAIFASLGSAASRDVMTSPTDMETPDALMARGALGFATSPNSNLPYLDNYNDTSKLINGASYVTNSQTLGEDKPFDGDACVVRVERYGANDAIMFAWRGLRNSNGGVLFRTWSNINGYEKWQRFYHTNNAVGAVSQSGGALTGGLMDWGETPNGMFFRYANGEQRCYHWYIISDSFPRNTQVNIGAWMFPAPFISHKVSVQVSVALDASTGGRRGRVELAGSGLESDFPSRTRSPYIFVVCTDSQYDASRAKVMIEAVGRWY